MTDGPYGEKLVNSVALTLIARIAMVVAAVALPIAGWMIQRGISGVDQISAKMDAMRDSTFETNATVKMIQSTQDRQSKMLDDHESRMRVQENLARAAPRL